MTTAKKVRNHKQTAVQIKKKIGKTSNKSAVNRKKDIGVTAPKVTFSKLQPTKKSSKNTKNKSFKVSEKAKCSTPKKTENSIPATPQRKKHLLSQKEYGVFVTKAAHKENVRSEELVTVDRRKTKTASEQHLDTDTHQINENNERRMKVQRRRQIDPTTCERDYSQEEIEFMTALDEYKRNSGRMFPTCSEILEVFRGLGYVKQFLAESVEIRTNSDSGDISVMTTEINTLIRDV